MLLYSSSYLVTRDIEIDRDVFRYYYLPRGSLEMGVSGLKPLGRALFAPLYCGAFATL
jgi:hypothetical protein